VSIENGTMSMLTVLTANYMILDSTLAHWSTLLKFQGYFVHNAIVYLNKD